MGDRKPKRTSTGTVTVNGVTARRTRRAQSPASKRKVEKLRVAQMRQTAYEMQLQYVAQADIAKALGIGRSRVSQLLSEEFELRKDGWEKTAEQWREQECRRIEAFCSKWARKAESIPRAADVLRTWAERRDRILGLYISKTELSGPGGRPLGASTVTPFDMSLLSDDELKQWEYLMQKASGTLPPAPPTDEQPAPVIMTATAPEPRPQALLEDRRPAPVTEFIPKAPIELPSLESEIVRLHAAGLHVYDIADQLGTTRPVVFAALEAATTRKRNSTNTISK